MSDVGDQPKERASAPAPSGAAVEGRTLGDFVVGPKIGEGGFGAVYRAHQVTLDRPAVIKVLHHRLRAAGAATERFLREARLASRLDHPYAAHIYAFGAEPDGTLWIAMELVRGTPLAEYLRVHGPLPLERLVPLLERICEVVHTAHEQGIVHRDLKPSNVMVLARAGRLLPKLLDFGIAKGISADGETPLPAPLPPPRARVAIGETLDASSDPVSPRPALPPTLSYADDDTIAPATVAPVTGRPPARRAVGLDLKLTQEGAVMGSPHYMAPEQWRDAASSTAQTDLYALGVLAYEAMTGAPPFAGSVGELAAAHLRARPPPLPASLPPRLDDVIGRALAKQPEDRFATALEMAAAFRHAAGLRAETPALPRLDEGVRERYVGMAPRPLAEAVAALDAATDVRQARDALWTVTSVLARWLGVLGLSVRSRLGASHDGHAALAAVREAGTTVPGDEQWLGIGLALARSHAAAPDLHPIPELVLFLCEPSGEDGIGLRLHRELTALRSPLADTAAADDALLGLLETALRALGALLREADFVCDYEPACVTADGHAESWSGLRRRRRDFSAALGAGRAGVLLLDRSGTPVLALDPVVQVAHPTPTDPAALFVYAGRDAHGARLTAAPLGFELHDAAVVDWLRAQMDITGDDAAEAAGDTEAPYLGLRAFTSDDAARFLGRERAVDAGVNRLHNEPLLAVVGPSGAGKSSYVQAGLLPALTGWRAAIVRPGAAPAVSLVARLAAAGLDGLTAADLIADPARLGDLVRADAGRRGPFVLVIDQLEELFTLCRDEAERAAFAQAIAGAARTADDPVRVVVTLRDDFLVTAESFAGLRDRLARSLLLLTTPDRDDLIRIVAEPARRAGYAFEDPHLPERMVDEVEGQPSALALLSFTAAELWERRDRHFRRLPTRAYEQLGGVGGALARHAEQLLEGQPAHEQRLVREAFRHLVTAEGTRAILSRAELAAVMGGGDAADAVIERLVVSRLLIARDAASRGDEEIEVTHEALISAWPRLVAWRREDAEGARLRDQLRAAARQWDDRGRPAGLLWRGDALAEYRLWRARTPGGLTAVETAFAAASLRDAARAARLRTVLVAAALAVLAIGVVALLVLNTRAERQRGRAEHNEEAARTSAAELRAHLLAQYEDQGRRQVLDGDPFKALAFLDEAERLGAAGPAHDLLVAQAVRAISSQELRVRHGSWIKDAVMSPDGSVLVSCGFDARARVWDSRTGATIKELVHDAPVTRCSFSGDGAMLVTASEDGRASLWDTRTWRRLHDLPDHRWQFHCAELSPDGRRIVTMDAAERVRLWDASTGALVHTLHPGSETPRMQFIQTPCAFRPDGVVVAVGDATGTLRVWDVASGRLITERAAHRRRVHAVRFAAPDGAILATSSEDGTAVVWDARTWEKRHVLAHEASVNGVAFDPTGALLLSVSNDRTGVVWDTRTGARRATLRGHAAAVYIAAFRGDGAQVATGGNDNTVKLWDPQTGQLQATLIGHAGSLSAVRYAGDGARVVTASFDGTAAIWSSAPQRPTTHLLGHAGGIFTGAFSPDGTRVVTGGLDGVLRIWTREGTLERELAGVEGYVQSAAYSPDGRRIASGGQDMSVRIWDAASGQLVQRLDGHTDAIRELAWSRDGSRIVTASLDGTARVWTLATGDHAVHRPHGGRAVMSIDLGADGRVVTTGDDDTTAVWDVETGAVVTRWDDPDSRKGATFDPGGRRLAAVTSRSIAKVWASDGTPISELLDHAGDVEDVAWRPDGEFVVTASFDGTAGIWDARTGALLVRLSGGATSMWSATFSPDGRDVLTGAGNGVAMIWRLPERVGDLAAILRCRVPYRLVDSRITRITLPPCTDAPDAQQVHPDAQ